LGFGYEALEIPTAVTANLNVNYVAPVEGGTTIVVKAYLTAQVGRKLYWEAKVESLPVEEHQVFCEASSLFIIPRNVYEAMMERKEESQQA
jgi:acyl-coenzyme A thioesterase PaaI-like protein